MVRNRTDDLSCDSHMHKNHVLLCARDHNHYRTLIIIIMNRYRWSLSVLCTVSLATVSWFATPTLLFQYIISLIIIYSHTYQHNINTAKPGKHLVQLTTIQKNNNKIKSIARQYQKATPVWSFGFDCFSVRYRLIAATVRPSQWSKRVKTAKCSDS